MGRHSAPDDGDADLDEAPSAGPVTAVATLAQGRHTGEVGSRPRPAPDVDDGAPTDSQPATDGMAFLEDALAPAADPGAAPPAPDPEDRTTEIPLIELARDDRPVPEEVTARIPAITDDAEPQRPHPAPIPNPASTAAPSPAPPAPFPPAFPTAPPVTTAAPEALKAPKGKPATSRGAHATRHDLALVMGHGDVRARVLAAVLVPFALYAAVLAVVDKLTVHSLVWVWAPAVVAGVLVGLVLDAGHRRYPAPSPVQPSQR